MVQGIQGDGGLTPSQKKELQSDYQDTAKKFQAALDKFSDRNLNEQQQGECKRVMHEYMDIMSHIAADLKGSKSAQAAKLQKDLDALDKNPSATDDLKKDLAEAKNLSEKDL